MILDAVDQIDGDERVFGVAMLSPIKGPAIKGALPHFVWRGN
jgi:hypothetical protein